MPYFRIWAENLPTATIIYQELQDHYPGRAGEIVDHFSVTGASISRHLSVLKEADLIRDRREGKFIYYELNASVLEEIMLWITDLKGESDHDGND